MPSVLSHPAVPLALAFGARTARVPPRLLAVACAASVIPDLDAIGYWLGVPYDSLLGHRGLTHSLTFALVAAAVCGAFARWLRAPARVAFGVTFAAMVSHGLLDALTTGGMGVAFFSPFSNRRFFLPWQVIRVSPISVGRFISERGIAVLGSELTWVWLPCVVLALLAAGLRRSSRAV